MKFAIPFTLSGIEASKKYSKKLLPFVKTKKSSFMYLEDYLRSADVPINKDEYIAICLNSFITFFVLLAVFFTTILFFLKIDRFYLYALAASILFSSFIFIIQFTYPKIFCLWKTRDLERNLLPALQDMLVQLNSGVPLFKILANISHSDYGEVSKEFGRAVKDIGSGKPQIIAIDEIGKRTTSVYFRRVLWQISNGMRAGSDMAVVIKESIDSLSKEQIIQIQSYGSKLNPIVMMYLLITVIVPALGITFMMIIFSMLNLSPMLIKMLFVSVFILVVIFQIMFLGMIKSRRPSLL